MEWMHVLVTVDGLREDGPYLPSRETDRWGVVDDDGGMDDDDDSVDTQ